ncbi:MAG: glycosyltransferase family 4 protein [Bacteroidales bacterium]|nr:glycosyltransferase family 4 protein [Bacteroidales bacterium]
MINLINNLDPLRFESEVLLLKNSVIADKLNENNIKYKIAKSKFYNKHYRFFAHSEAGYVKWYHLYNFMIKSISWILSRYILSKRELARHTFDIVHLNSSVLTDWLAPAKQRGKVVIHIREPFRKGKLDFLNFFFKSIIKQYADQIIAISEDNARRISIPAKTVVIYDYCSIPVRKPINSSYASKKVLYLGGSSTSKGFYAMVDALDNINSDVKVYFGGLYIESVKPRNMIEFLRYFFSNAKKRNSAIQKIKKQNNTKLIGLVYEVDNYFEEVACLVSPFSVPHFSCPVIEAYAHMKPVIGSDVEGMDEIIQHEITGLLVARDNPLALAKAINLITSDSIKAKRFGEAGYKIATKKFTSKNIKQLENIYDRLFVS